MMTDRIADMLTRIRNAQLAGLEKVELPASKMLESIAHILKDEGYIAVSKSYNHKGRRYLRLALRYEEGKPVIRDIQRVSRPGRRVYAGAGELPRVKGGFGIAIVSTSHGIMSDGKARQSHIGGEIVCTVF